MKRMRSPAEIRFRLRQEAANLYLLLAQPKHSGSEPSPFQLLPDPSTCAAAMRGSLFEFTVLASAKNVLAHRFPLLGTALDTGPAIDWRRDYAHGKTSAAKYFRLVPYLNFAAVGDHKFIWELNRHQHLVLLAQAYLFSRQTEYLQEIFAQLESWLEQNPFQKGINWASALEVAFRALSWIWLWHLCGQQMPPRLQRKFLTSLYQHGRHLAENLSVYFSPNTHLLGEAVALHALGTLFPAFAHSAAWRKRGGAVVEEQLEFQVKPDGSHFEQSSYYHVYALDFFVFYYVLAGRPARLEPALQRMAEYLQWLLGPARRIAFFGDDDGGRLFHPQGKRDEFGRATLATCGILSGNEDWIGSREELFEQAVWWLGPECVKQARAKSTAPSGARVFADAGAVFFRSGDLYVQVDAGPFGWGGAGHSHADTLSLVAWWKDEPVFLDPGTFTYISDPHERDRFRGTALHNTVCIDGQNQAQAAGPFRWAQKPTVRMSASKGGLLDALCEYGGFQHRRRVLLAQEKLLVLDEVTGPAGEHLLEQRWNLGGAADRVFLSFSEEAELGTGTYSPSYGTKLPCAAWVVRTRKELPWAMAMLLDARQKTAISVAEARRMFDNEEARHS